MLFMSPADHWCRYWIAIWIAMLALRGKVCLEGSTSCQQMPGHVSPLNFDFIFIISTAMANGKLEHS